MQPRISVIIPAYNAEEYIANAINSILNQSSHTDETEIIVIDDRSSDKTKEVVLDLAKGHPAVKLFDNERSKGPSGARNIGLLNANGEYIAFLDADDMWYADHLERAISFLVKQKDVDIIFYNFDIHDLDTKRDVGDWFSKRKSIRALEVEKLEDKYFVIRDDMLNALLAESFLHLQSMVIKRSVVEGVLFNESVMRSGDRDFAISMVAKSEAVFAFGDMVTSVWYRHDNSLTTNSADNFLAMSLDHITFYTEYLSLYSQRPNTSPILKRMLFENHMDACYLYRQKNDLWLSLKHLITSYKYGFDYTQIRELIKIVGAFLIYKILQRHRQAPSNSTN